MCPDLAVDFVAPPFAGHLFPLLDLARSLRERGMSRLRIRSTADASEATLLSGFEMLELLPGRSDAVRAIADTDRRVGGNPLRLARQFRANLSLMKELSGQLRDEWSHNRPDVVIADFTIPVAGLVAMSLGIPWWTSMPSPCAMESHTGTPTYVGGWMPRPGMIGAIRDAAGRHVIRLFKKSVRALFARKLRELGITDIYREDGSEVVYSPERIFGLGMAEFEFPRDWPRAFSFIGPLTASPPFPHESPEFPPGKRPILVTLGTHLPWARERAASLMEGVAERMPDCIFHFALGRAGSSSHEVRENLHMHGFLPYDQYLHRYVAAVIHGGTGITYSCIQSGVPILVWPHDYDQHDHSARIVHNGIGLRLDPKPDAVVRDLRRLMDDGTIRSRVEEFRATSSRYDPAARVLEVLREVSTAKLLNGGP